MPGLDVLRGIAVVAVVCHHGIRPSAAVGLPNTPAVARLITLTAPGFLGVNLFFVLSGFLITGILLDTRTRSNYWPSFYVRRALRILPLYLTTLIVIRLLFHLSWTYIACCLLFIANLVENRYRNYGPLWSLAVEEQFYLVWPWLVRRLRLRTLAILCLLSITLSPALRVLAGHYPLGNPYDTTWLISDFLLLGALIAIFLRSPYASHRNTLLFSSALALLSLFFFALCARFHLLDRTSILGRAFQAEPFLFLFGLLLMAALKFGNRPWIIRLSAPLRFYGYISYGLYLLNYAFFSIFFAHLDAAHPPSAPLSLTRVLLRFLLALAIMTLACYLSRTLFEERFLRLKDRLVPYTRSKPRPTP
jgi:peptidoglycan/LPS O-acetylase OafA/YrhL